MSSFYVECLVKWNKTIKTIETDTNKDKDDNEVTDHFDLMFNLFYFYECFSWSAWEVKRGKCYISNFDGLGKATKLYLFKIGP